MRLSHVITKAALRHLFQAHSGMISSLKRVIENKSNLKLLEITNYVVAKYQPGNIDFNLHETILRYTNIDLKIFRYLCLHLKKYVES